VPHQTELHEPEAAFLSKPDSIDVRQYLHTLHRRAFTEPEMRLMLVVLQDALSCLDKYVLTRNRKGKMLFHETEDWVFTTNEDWVFSFNNICEALGFNPEYVRKGVTQWKTAKLDVERGPPTAKSSCLGE
jgi:hypothetical protein